ncbi:MAG: 50S ribosomal protein L29 [Cytophagales bacterium]|nr:50S ribosomal protein L29 [Armatimonadota bacterium]
MPNNKLAKQNREELSVLDAAALRAQLQEANKTLWTDTFALGKRNLENTSRLATTRKRIARIQTYLRQLELKETK